VAVQGLNEELTVVHSVKLVKATLQGAGAHSGAFLHNGALNGAHNLLKQYYYYLLRSRHATLAHL